MSSQRGPGSRGKAGHVVLPGYEPFVAGGREGLLSILQEEGKRGRERKGREGERKEEQGEKGKGLV